MFRLIGDGDRRAVITFDTGEDCVQATSSLGGRVRLPADFENRLRMLFRNGRR